MPAVDVGIVRTLGSPDGRAILRGLPAYDEREVMRLQDRLRKEGHDPDFVAAAADPAAAARPGRGQVRRVRRRHALHRRRARAGLPARGRGDPRRAVLQRLAGDRARPRLRHRLGCRGDVGARRHRAGRRRRPGHRGDRRHQPAALAGLAGPGGAGRGVRGARATRCARGSGVWLDPARRVPGKTGRHGRIKRVFRLDEIQPTWEFVLQVATAVPATGAKLSPVDAARRHPARHRGPVDLVRRRGARVRRVVGAAGAAAGPQRRASCGPDRSPIEVDETMAEPEIPDGRVARRGRAVALRARPRGDPGRPARRGRPPRRWAARSTPGSATSSARRTSTCRSPAATPCAR